MNADATSDAMLGSISTNTTRSGPSPETIAAWMNSRLRSVSACARNTRALHAHPANDSTTLMLAGPGGR